MYGTQAPSAVVKVPTSRAWTMAAERLDSDVMSLPSWMNPSSSFSR
jgi:hypothetical protein